MSLPESVFLFPGRLQKGVILMRLFGVLFILAAMVLPSQAESPLQPYPLDKQMFSRPGIDVSFLLEAPAGKYGFIKVQEGKLVDGRGRRFRFWGINLTGAATTPHKEDTAALAAFPAILIFGRTRSNWPIWPREP